MLTTLMVRKTMSLCVEEDSQGKKYNMVKELELISMSSEPGGQYVTHLEPEGGKGEQIADSVLGFLTSHKLADSWQIVGGDTTAPTQASIMEPLLVLRRSWGGSSHGCFVCCI